MEVRYGSSNVLEPEQRSSSLALTSKSNGTSTFLPTTILISIDGFRADFIAD